MYVCSGEQKRRHSTLDRRKRTRPIRRAYGEVGILSAPPVSTQPSGVLFDPKQHTYGKGRAFASENNRAYGYANIESIPTRSGDGLNKTAAAAMVHRRRPNSKSIELIRAGTMPAFELKMLGCTARFPVPLSHREPLADQQNK